MNKQTLYFAAIASLFMAVNVMAQTEEPVTPALPGHVWKLKAPVEYGREFPRSQTISYDSQEAALGRSHEASTYLQPLGAQWNITASGDGTTTTYSHPFKMPFAWVDRQVFLHIGSADAPYEIYVNDQLAGYNQSSKIPAEFNVTKFTKEGMNTLNIVIHGDAAAMLLEKDAKTGKPSLTGEVYLVAQPRIRVRDFVQRTVVENGEALLELGVIMKSHLLNPKMLTMHYAFYSPDGTLLSSGRRDKEIDMRQEDTIYFNINVPNAKLWSPDEPNLYTFVAKIQNEGRYWEYVPYRIGIRTAGLENGKLLVNGIQFPFRTAQYKTDSREAATAAMPDLKTQGINFIIPTEPQPEWFYELCDEYGFFVLDRTGIDTAHSGVSREKGGNPANDPQWADAYMDRALGTIYTSQNHPSVVGFSPADNPANGYNLYETYLGMKSALAQRGDKRPVVFTEAGAEWNTDAVSPAVAQSKPESVANRFILTSDNSPLKDAVSLGEKDAAAGSFYAMNNLIFKTIDTSIQYTVRQGRSKVSQGAIPIVIAPGEQVSFNVPYGKAKAGKGLEVELSMSVQGGNLKNVQTITKSFPVAY